MDAALAEQVRLRANHACEYCRLPEGSIPGPFPIDHVIARQHRGITALSNLANSCLHCNTHKGPNIAGLDPITGELTRLFNPRRHRWPRHFRWKGPFLVGRTPIGRTTIEVLAMNAWEMVRLREALMEEGSFPPPDP